MSPSAITILADARICGQLAFSTRPLNLARLPADLDEAEATSSAS